LAQSLKFFGDGETKVAVPATGFHYDDPSHTYWLDGREIPGFSRILQDVGVVDLSSIPPKVLEKARERGHKVHLACQYVDENRMDWASLDEELLGRVTAWIKFCSDYQFKPAMCGIEVPTYHKQFLYGITPDRYGTIGRIRDSIATRPWASVVEIKNTYAEETDKWGMQVAAQAAALKSHGKLDPKDNNVVLYSVNLKADGSYVAQLHDDPTALNKFMSCLCVYGLKRSKK